MVRSCHLDTCPVGIATQRPELRAKFAATPEAVEAYLLFVAEEVRRLLASLGLRSLAEAVGRADLLRARDTCDRRSSGLTLAHLLRAPAGAHTGEPPPTATGGELGKQLAVDAAAALEEERIVDLRYEIANTDRVVGARLGVEIARRFGTHPPPGRVRARFEGSAGQSFGAFLAPGVDLEVVGECNDYVGKGMSGGRIVVLLPPNDSGNAVLLGNAVLYGATGGELFAAGRAGERFAVRNSGATAVVEGAGDHCCEYMTGGMVVVLGDVGLNVGAGMTGGELYVCDVAGRLPLRLNGQLVVAERGATEGVRALIEDHLRHTGSPHAADLLERWDEAASWFWRVVPRTELAAIPEAAKGASAAV
jgi:glutamate synthase domain-containing protein 3